MKKKGFLIAICVLTYAAWGQGAPTPSSAQGNATMVGAGTPVLQQRNPRFYKIGMGDVMEVEFRFTPEFNQTVTVQPDGYITLNEIGDVHIQGMNAPDATESIRAASAKILHDPVVTIVLKDFDKPFFIANGQIRAPGKYELRSSLTVTEAIAVAGGFTDASKHSQVWLYHSIPNDQFEVKVLNLKRMLKAGDLSEDVRIQPGDMLFVPQNTISKLKSLIVPRSSIGLGTTYRW
jgi:polysaccharide export outer membrane protein